jgi:hypothetical protein
MANQTQFSIKINGVEQLVNLNDILQTNVRSLKDLKEQKDIIEQAFEQADFGSESANRLESSLRDVNTQLKNIDEATSDLVIGERLEGIARIGTSIGASFAIASQGIQLFGDTSQETAEQIQKTEQQLLFFIGTLETLEFLTLFQQRIKHLMLY